MKMHPRYAYPEVRRVVRGVAFVLHAALYP